MTHAETKDGVIRVTVWNENIHESRGDELVNRLYPDGIHGAIADGLDRKSVV